MSLIDSNRNQPQKEIALFGDYIPQKTTSLESALLFGIDSCHYVWKNGPVIQPNKWRLRWIHGLADQIARFHVDPLGLGPLSQSVNIWTACMAQGFFVTLGFAVALYNAMLCVYCMAIIW
jgi:hypothetical protein